MIQAYTLTDLGNSGAFSFADGINDAGQVVGYSAGVSVAVYATLWSGGAAINLGGLSGNNGGVAEAINDLGQGGGRQLLHRRWRGRHPLERWRRH